MRPAGTADLADVIVIGGGHAGSEAALAAARIGATVILVTMSPANIASMPCNPAIGGPGKGHLVREVDAMGGAIGAAADAAAVQIRLLNTSKGPAVQALRAITDKAVYAAAVRRRLEAQDGLAIRYGQVVRLAGEAGGGYAVELDTGESLSGRAVVVATGVYMEAATVVGEQWREGGPGEEPSSRGLSAALSDLGLATGRFKTGTSPRVDRCSVDFAALRPEPGLAVRLGFSHFTAPRGAVGEGQVAGDACWQTHTTEATHAIVMANLHRSPLFCGEITGRGPRHCPSIEDKVMRFRDRPRHPVYLELERQGGRDLYVLGMSTSLPADVQLAMLRTMPGLERVDITTPGYAIEYDFIKPGQLFPTLETKREQGLFFAGQVCGTSGYEEAAALGLVAGTNAARRAAGKEPAVWPRAESYIGVLADDLTTKDVTEPYRVMTARAEHRLHLRHTNADLRLTAWACRLGLVPAECERHVAERRLRIASVRKVLKEATVRATEGVNAKLRSAGASELRSSSKAYSLLRRPEVSYQLLQEIIPELPTLTFDDQHEVGAEAKYGGYIRQQERQIAKHRRLAGTPLPASIDYLAMAGLSAVARSRLKEVRPLTLGQAARVEGVSPADLAVIEAYLHRYGARQKAGPGRDA